MDIVIVLILCIWVSQMLNLFRGPSKNGKIVFMLHISNQHERKAIKFSFRYWYTESSSHGKTPLKPLHTLNISVFFFSTIAHCAHKKKKNFIIIIRVCVCWIKLKRVDGHIYDESNLFKLLSNSHGFELTKKKHYINTSHQTFTDRSFCVNE